jgi:hypothetical protein
MSPITFPKDTKSIIDQIRTVIGREVYFFTETSITCSACSIDPITNNSTNPFCNVCGGKGYIYTNIVTVISAHITWAGLDVLNWPSGGQIFQGDCGLQIEYTDANLTLADTAKYVIVDTRKVEINKKILRGVPTLNRILLDCQLDD